MRIFSQIPQLAIPAGRAWPLRHATGVTLLEPGREPKLETAHYAVHARSVVVLRREPAACNTASATSDPRHSTKSNPKSS